MHNNVKSFVLHKSLRDLKTVVAELNTQRELLIQQLAQLEQSNATLGQRVQYLQEQSARLRDIAAESEILEKWIQDGDYSNPPILTASINAAKKST
jgi:cell division protein FtsB